ncbi:unnamed protein product [Nippostrongylus brasiliensis]|uniref:ABF-2 (inferred by orthology to a C. elegans protein) n=1 Tax=Nippostrongylus brasiliensis TaxID=27835 RepID=A0A0N4XVR6_NIPBR|nr:unnamed protein product [Nippostrongylus brasiliensis]
MRQFLLCFLLIGVFVVSSHARYLTTCARMDGGAVLSKAARLACISSCKFQNCGTGYCKKVGYRKTCVCSRCR